MPSITRRCALTALAAASYSRILGANDRVQVGFIGYGLIGTQHVFDFKNQKDSFRLAFGRLCFSAICKFGTGNKTSA